VIIREVDMLTETQKKEIKNKLQNWANTNKAFVLQTEELTRLNCMCEEMRENMKYLPENAMKTAKNSIEICEERISQLNDVITENRNEKEALDKIIDNLDPVEQIIIRKRYLDHTSWDFIIAFLPVSMSIRQIYRLHNDTLEKISKQL
jgi:DNA-directed RNA polymerase specialized sigma subunit